MFIGDWIIDRSASGPQMLLQRKAVFVVGSFSPAYSVRGASASCVK